MKRHVSRENFERNPEYLSDRFLVRALAKWYLGIAAIVGSFHFLASLALSESQLAGVGLVMSAMLFAGTFLFAPGDR